jgi:riboflavin synthase
MFTGLVSDVGEVSSVEPRGALRRVRVLCSYPSESIALGASIACGGPCLTVVGSGIAHGKSWFDVDIAAETLARTTAVTWKPGEQINLERSLKIGDELGGHIVTGHIDGIAEILSIEDFDGMKRFWIRAPHGLSRFIAEKGSVSLDGTSLTVNGVKGDAFSILLIPHTLHVTTWGGKRTGDAVNLEVDLMARYAARLSETAPAKVKAEAAAPSYL